MSSTQQNTKQIHWGHARQRGTRPSAAAALVIAAVSGSGAAARVADAAGKCDRIATYSSRDPSRLDFVMKPDIVAPGNRVVAATADKSYLDTRYQDTNRVGATE